MKLNRDLLRIASAVFIVAITAVLSGRASAQDTRPRYNSPQNAEQAWTLPPDTVISVQMNGTLSSRIAHVGDFPHRQFETIANNALDWWLAGEGSNTLTSGQQPRLT